MTNEELKQEAIKKAYGEYFEQAKPNQDGWCEYRNINNNIFKELNIKGYNSFCDNTVRPASLTGIETNNGWVLLDSTTPNEIEYEGDIWIENKLGEIIFVKENEFIPLDYAVAYQPVIKPKKRIY